MDEASFIRAFAALLVVLGLLGALYYGLRRFSNFVPTMDSAADLRIVTWRPMDGRKKLAIIRWGDTEHLVITGPAGDTKIAERDAPDRVAPVEGTV